MQYSISEIAKACDGKLQGNAEAEIRYISADSRTIIHLSQTLFFAIRGKNLDGHLFIRNLIDKGCSCFVISDSKYIINTSKYTYIVVPDVIEAMQKIAAYHRKMFNIPLIGITGSNGKTIVKEWLAFLLGSKYRITRSPKSYNSQTGVPLSVCLLNKESKIGVFEAGISQVGEMKNLETVIRPNIGVFTNIGEAHQQFFNNIEQKVSEKALLFKSCPKIIYSADEPIIANILHKQNPSSDFISWSLKGNGDINAKTKQTDNITTEIQIQYKKESFKINIPFVNTVAVKNALSCFATLLIMNEPIKEYLPIFSNLSAVAMRMEVLNGINGCRIINDSYNSDFQALSIAIDQLVQQSGKRKTILIVSDILQTGTPDDILYRDLADLIDAKNIDELIGIGSSISKYASYFSSEAEFYQSTEEYMQTRSYLKFRDSAILLKGARLFAFEKIVKLLQEKSHQTVFEVNLDVVESNLNYFRQIVGKQTRIMIMVKAFSYGSGYFEIANHLQYLKVDYLAVAYADEGVALRKAGIYLPIMVMNPEPDAFSMIEEYNLEPELYSVEILNSFANFSQNTHHTFKIHIKLDTGMHRLGFGLEDIPYLNDVLENNPSLKIASVYTHLVATDNPSFDYFTNEQVKLYHKILAKFTTNTGLLHVLNSNGIIRFPQYHFDMVRLGIGLYGISSELKANIKPTSVFKTTVSQLRNVLEDETIGYNRSGKLQRNSYIATIPVGYADGINRKLGNGNWSFKINGKLVPSIGDICMDMCMIDVTGLDVSIGDEVIILDDEISASKMASKLGTISYEVLTNIGHRVKRVYVKE